MIENLKSYSYFLKTSKVKNAKNSPVSNCTNSPISTNQANFKGIFKTNLSNINTTLSSEDAKKYTYLVNFLKDVPVSPNAQSLSCNKQLDHLLKNGKLLAKSKQDNSTTLDNLYEIATQKRTANLDSRQLISNILDNISNPRIITQNFGDIPDNEKAKILSNLPQDDEIRQNPSLINVQASGTCAAASLEVNLADKHPAEYARWVSKLSSEQEAVMLDVKLSSISKNKLDAITILNMLEARKTSFSFDKTQIKISPDKNAYTRAQIQTKYWDKGERNVADVLIQSALMQLGSQNTYNSLTDTRAGNFSTNPQGLIELEKTFVESLIEGEETTSLTYHKVDDDQNLIGYNCSFDKIQKHITDTLNSGKNVVIGYVLTNETSGRSSSAYYNSAYDGAPNKIINGHEIIIVGHKTTADGKTSFICIDTDDDNDNFIEYSADWLIPKIHHAGYPAELVAQDEKEIFANSLIA